MRGLFVCFRCMGREITNAYLFCHASTWQLIQESSLLQETLEVLEHYFEVRIIAAAADDATGPSTSIGSLHSEALLDAVNKDTETQLLVLLKFGSEYES